MRAKKSLGQNFLKSPAVALAMVEVAQVSTGDTVLEIGPGKGALTKHLLKTGAYVVAVEKDADMIPLLEATFSDEVQSKQLTLVHDSITTASVKSLLRGVEYKVVANIPYNITGEIVRMFLESLHQPLSMTLLVQKEVAQRIVAKGGKESILSISVKAYGVAIYVQKVPAMLFKPRPRVDSAVLHIAEISKDFFAQHTITEHSFFTIVKTGFAQKRKKLTNNLTVDSSILAEFGIEANARAETLTLTQWGQLTKRLAGEV